MWSLWVVLYFWEESQLWSTEDKKLVYCWNQIICELIFCFFTQRIQYSHLVRYADELITAQGQGSSKRCDIFALFLWISRFIYRSPQLTGTASADSPYWLLHYRPVEIFHSVHSPDCLFFTSVDWLSTLLLLLRGEEHVNIPSTSLNCNTSPAMNKSCLLLSPPSKPIIIKH